MQSLYNIFISLMIFGMKIASAFNYKIKKGLAGRRLACETVKKAISKDDKVIWMHSASLGEYEQGLPVLEELKKLHPGHKILITFFSPSGYENVVKRKTIADAITYLPFDRKKWIREFTSHFKTDIFFTVKYDYWYNLLAELKEQGAKNFVVSAYFYETQIFFKVYGKWFTSQLKKNIDWFFHQTKHSTALAKSIGLEKSFTTGDTRYDRVKKQLTGDNSVDYISEFVQNNQVLLFGSSWEAEEHIAEIVASKNKNVKIIIAPHDLKRVEHLKKLFPDAVLYSKFKTPDSHLSSSDPRLPSCDFKPTESRISNLKSQILIIDCIGLLSKLYSYADIAVVGGGFHSAGLHNILEPAVFGVPVFFGDHYKEKPEADEIIRLGGGKAFEDEFFAGNYILNLLKHPELIEKMGKNASEFIRMQPNATNLVVDKIKSLIK